MCLAHSFSHQLNTKLDMEKKMIMNNNNKSCVDKFFTTQEEEEEAVVLPGFRFHPTDEELVGFYLRRKVEKKTLSSIEKLIKQADIYKHDPWDLPSSFSGDIKEWYFFCKRGRKYKNSVRPNRVTGSGFWKATGIDKSIYNTSGVVVGLKKSLVYYRGSAGKGTKTEWMMHEFRLPPPPPPTSAKQNPMNMMVMTMPYVHSNNNFAQQAEIWTLCRIFRRTTSYKRCAPVMKPAHIKQQQCHTTFSDSATNSLDSDIVDPYHPTLSRNALGLEYIEQKLPVFDHILGARSYPLFTGKFNSAATYNPALAFPSIGSGSWNSSRQEEFFGDDWDELRPVVECNVDPSHSNHAQLITCNPVS